MKHFAPIVLLLCLLTSANLLSQIPNTFTYQGLLTQSGAAIINGTYSLKFEIYNASAGGTLRHTETFSNVSVQSGRFSVTLGSTVTLPDIFTEPLYIQMTALSGPSGVTYPLVFSPRSELTSVPYALHARIADSVQNNNGTFLPLTGGTMTGAISNSGNPPITMGKGSFGVGNTNTGEQSFVAGSNNNARGSYTVVSGGGGADATDSNSAKGSYSTIGGGARNITLGDGATISGGVSNAANDFETTVSGGLGNLASGNYSTVSGGKQNTTSGLNATVGGGVSNTASGISSTIPGGQENVAAGNYSLAAGQQAKANHNGTFVWADNSNTDFASTDTNQFLIRASGGVGIGKTHPFYQLDVNGIINATDIYKNGSPLSSGISQWTTNGSNIYYNAGNVGIGTNAPAYTLDVAGSVNSSSALRVQGTPNYTSGKGLELFYSPSDIAGIASFDRTSSTLKELFLTGSTVQIIVNGSNTQFGSGSKGLTVMGSAGTYGPSIGVHNGSQEWRLVSWSDNAFNIVKTTGTTFVPFAIHNTSFNNEMVLASNGVGIGTNAPTEKLEVAGTVKATAFVGDGSGLTGVTSTTSGVSNVGSTTIAADNDGDGNGEISFQTNQATRMTISNNGNIINNGNLGIGVDPTYKLDVAGMMNASQSMRAQGIPSYSSGKGLELFYHTGLDYGSVQSYDRSSSLWKPLQLIGSTVDINTNGSTTLFATGGKVGIGTSSPGKPLTINGGTNDPISLLSTSNHDWYVGPNAGSGSGFGIHDVTTGGTSFKIDLNGNVGIGTTTPTAKLEAVVNHGAVEATAVYGYSHSTSDVLFGGVGVLGSADTGVGVLAATSSGWAMYAYTGSGYAGIFDGNVAVYGTLSKSAGSFKIDHPLDPENKYLYHSFVESPDMKNIYDGIISLDGEGKATVELPNWFEALNNNFRYQLTCIGGYAPVYISEEVKENRFTISGGKPGMKVSWQVTGIRKDAYANAHRIQVEEDKPVSERGKYLHPTELGFSEEKGIDFEMKQRMKQRLERK
jgi:hypothetical protein